jgi:phage tail-like protein
MTATAERADPILAFKFVIELDDVARGGFSQCGGLQLETAVQDYPEGGLNDHVWRFPTRTTQSNITLKRGIVDRDLWDWYYDLTLGKVRFKEGSIIVYDPSGASPVMVWHFHKAFPRKWVGPELNATQSSVAVETLELCHHGLELRRLERP